MNGGKGVKGAGIEAKGLEICEVGCGMPHLRSPLVTMKQYVPHMSVTRCLVALRPRLGGIIKCLGSHSVNYILGSPFAAW